MLMTMDEGEPHDFWVDFFNDFPLLQKNRVLQTKTFSLAG